MSRIIYCDLCGKKVGDVSVSGVEMVDDGNARLDIGDTEYKEVCVGCFIAVFEFIENLKKKG